MTMVDNGMTATKPQILTRASPLRTAQGKFAYSQRKQREIVAAAYRTQDKTAQMMEAMCTRMFGKLVSFREKKSQGRQGAVSGYMHVHG